MHFLLIHQAFADLDEPGGTRHAELVHFLVGQGHRVTVIASPVSYLSGKKSSQHKFTSISHQSPNLIIYRCYTYDALHRSFVHRVLSFLSFMVSSFLTSLMVRNVDLVWGTSPPIFQGATAWLVARLKRARFLFEVRDLWPAFAIAMGVLKNRVLIRASEWLERFLYRHADQVVINSPGFLEHVKASGARQVTLVPNSVDVDMYGTTVDPDNFREKNGIKDAFVVVYAGAHGLANDLGVLLDAADILKEEKKIQFVLVGDGKEKPALMQKAANMDLSNIHFLPPVAKQDMPEVLKAADAGLAILKPLELFKTTYPNKVFDYMAAGKPVILAIDGVIRQVLEAAGCGVFVPPGDPYSLAKAIKLLADNPDRARKMGRAGHDYVIKYFNRSESALKLQAVMEELLS